MNTHDFLFMLVWAWDTYTVIVDYTFFGSLEMIDVIVMICVLSTHVG